MSRGFAPDSGDALLTVRSHFRGPAMLARDGRGRCPPLRGRESAASCGANQQAGLREAGTPTRVGQDDSRPTTSQSLPVRAKARSAGGGHCQTLLSKDLRERSGVTGPGPNSSYYFGQFLQPDNSSADLQPVPRSNSAPAFRIRLSWLPVLVVAIPCAQATSESDLLVTLGPQA